MPNRPVIVGAVAYSLHVVTIWEAFREYFRDAGVPTDYVLFSNYESQVEALFNHQIDIAWNTNVAFARCERRTEGTCQVLGMRNVDVDYTTRFIARAGLNIRQMSDVKGRRFAFGSADSAQAAMIPAYYLRQTGIDPERDVQPLHFDLDVGKHGDTGTSELEVIRALQENQADAGGIADATWQQQLAAGAVNPESVESFWVTPGYCHCNFTALPDFNSGKAKEWSKALLAMDRANPRWRAAMDLENVVTWLPGRKDGYQVVAAALPG